MRTQDGQFTTSARLFPRVVRDFRVAAMVVGRALAYLVVGGRIRRRYRRAERRGDVYWVDEPASDPPDRVSPPRP